MNKSASQAIRMVSHQAIVLVKYRAAESCPMQRLEVKLADIFLARGVSVSFRPALPTPFGSLASTRCTTNHK